MSNRTKGRLHERMCVKVLSEKGWLVHLTDMPQRFKKHQDIFSIEDTFGGFDIIAIKKIGDKAHKMYVQVKTNDAWAKKTKEQMKWFKDTYLATDDIVQLWNWRNKSKKIGIGWEIEEV